MSVKVLLADESTTIKKAFQLALSEFAAEIKSVPSGLDVLSVSEEFQPDIIFADVLLTKKSGYEVCKELKAHPQLSSKPVILMWSSFMEFDTALAESSGYTDKIEKPFDSQAIKDKITQYVVRAQAHPLRDMIQSIQLPDFDESETLFKQKNLYAEIQKKKQELEATTQAQKTPATSLGKVQTKNTATQSHPSQQPLQIEEIEEISESIQQGSSQSSGSASDEILLETENYGDFEEVVLVRNDKVKNSNNLDSNVQNYLESSPVSLNRSQKQQLQNQKYGQQRNSNMSGIDEQLVREEVRLMAEKICWQIIPDITEKIIREEITKLMSQIEKSI